MCNFLKFFTSKPNQQLDPVIEEHIDNLYEAIRAGENVEHALSQFPAGFNFNQRLKYGFTPLHFAITKTTYANEETMLEIILLLLRRGVDLNQTAADRFNTSPLLTAARRGLVHTVCMLLTHGAEQVSDKNAFPLAYIQSAIELKRKQERRDETMERLEAIAGLLQSQAPAHRGFLGFPTVVSLARGKRG